MTNHCNAADPNEFRPYRERLDRCEAFSFQHPMQAERIARVLQADDYSLSSDAAGWEFHVDVYMTDQKTGQMVAARVERGDYLVRTNSLQFPYASEIEIVKPKDFRAAWEEDK